MAVKSGTRTRQRTESRADEAGEVAAAEEEVAEMAEVEAEAAGAASAAAAPEVPVAETRVAAEPDAAGTAASASAGAVLASTGGASAVDPAEAERSVGAPMPPPALPLQLATQPPPLASPHNPVPETQPDTSTFAEARCHPPSDEDVSVSRTTSNRPSGSTRPARAAASAVSCRAAVPMLPCNNHWPDASRVTELTRVARATDAPEADSSARGSWCIPPTPM
eukprot:scaffold3909_cov117-Isochrysis_galbana.AAC.8